MKLDKQDVWFQLTVVAFGVGNARNSANVDIQADALLRLV